MKNLRAYLIAVLVAANVAIRSDRVQAIDPVGSCHGDCTGDRRVDGKDLTVVLSNYGANPARWTQGDVNDDGKVDGGDLVVVLGTWQCREF